MKSWEDIPDVIKAGVSISPPALTLFGVSVEQWTFVLSGIVSLLFIIEKIPMIHQRIKALIQWMKKVKKK